MVYDMITECNCVADIGTDHAILPITLVKDGKCNNVIATDVNYGPIKIAECNIRNNNLQGKIETRLGYGLDVIKAGECETIVIAGMGGQLICDILKDNNEVAHKSKQIIVQPMNSHKEVRFYLLTNGYEIIDERSVKDGKHIYLAIKCRYSPESSYLPDDMNELFTGSKMFNRMDKDSIIYYKDMLAKTEQVLMGLDKTLNKDDEYQKKWNEYNNLKKRLDCILSGV